MTELINLCGLWKRKDKNDNEFFIGKLTQSTRIFIFKNRNLKSDSSPDYYICLSKIERETDGSKDIDEGQDVF